MLNVPLTPSIALGLLLVYTAAVTKVILSGCPLTGGKYSADVDTDLTGITTLFDELKGSNVTELGLSGCRLGPASMGKLAEYLREAIAVLASLTISGVITRVTTPYRSHRFTPVILVI